PTATSGGGSVQVVGGKVLYTSPTNAPTTDTFFYQISDNSSASRGGPLLAFGQVSVNVVDFVPKTISGTVYVDSNGNGLLDANEKVLSGVTVHLTGTDFANNPVSLTATTDINGKYSFAGTSGIGLAPPLPLTQYTVTEVQP